MKKLVLFIGGVSLIMLSSLADLRAQDDNQESKFAVGADVFTNYVWRGTKFGTGPAIQPSVKYTAGGLTVGVWGSFDAAGYTEADPYISYSFPFGLSIGVTDYYYPGLEVFDFSTATGSHALELNGGFATGGFSISANFIINEAGGAASAGSDTYFQAAYSFTNVGLFVGAGNGWHTSDGDFNLCNIGLTTTREIKITDSFSIPLTGQVILNPEREQFFLVAGFTF